MKHGNSHNFSNLSNAATVTSSLEIVKGREYENGVRRFKHGSLHLDDYLLIRPRYLARNVAVVLLRFLFKVLVLEVQCGREESIHLLKNFHSFDSLSSLATSWFPEYRLEPRFEQDEELN